MRQTLLRKEHRKIPRKTEKNKQAKQKQKKTTKQATAAQWRQRSSTGLRTERNYMK